MSRPHKSTNLCSLSQVIGNTGISEEKFHILFDPALEAMGFATRPDKGKGLNLEDYEIVPRHPRQTWERDLDRLEMVARCRDPRDQDCR